MSLTLFKRTESAPPIVPPVPPPDFPDASNTGPAAGTVFTTTTGNFQSTAPGQIIEKRTINNGMIDIRHANVTVRDCIVNSQDAGAIITTGAGPFAGCIIERCKLTGIGGSFAIFSDNATNMEIRFCDMSGYENGIAIGASGMNIHDNYIHGLFRLSGTPHIDGIQGSGGFTSLTIRHNTIVSWDTSCIIMQTEGGGFSGLVIDNNRLLFDTAHVGAELAYGILCQSVNANVAQNITITNNRIQKSQPAQNYIFANNLTQPVTISGNVDDTTGAPITPDGNVPLPATSGIPMSYNDPIFASNVPATISPLPGGASAIAESFLVSNANGDPVLVCLGNNTIQKCRFGSPYVREGIRIAGPGLMFIDQCYINVDGLAGSGDHADGIQAFTPGDVGTIFLNNTFIRAYNNGEGPGGEGAVGTFIADDWTGTFKCRNVVFQSGQFGCRAFPDVGGDMHIDFDGVYFVGPYNSAAFDIGQSIGGHVTVIDRWVNVFNATIVGGVIVPGSAIPPPIPVTPPGFPDSTNTGFTHAPGYPGSLSPAVAVASGNTYNFIDFDGGLGLNNLNNITFNGCRFRNNGTFNARLTNSTNIHFNYCSMVPLPAAPPNAAWPSAGAGLPVDGISEAQFAPYMIGGTQGPLYNLRLDGATGSNATIDHCDIWGGAIGIDLAGAIPTVLITNNWIHDNRNPVPADDHSNGVSYVDALGGRSFITIEHNTIASLGNTNCVGMQAATTPYSNMIIRNNYLTGYGICLDPFHDVVGSNNLEISGNTFATDIRWAFRPIRGGSSLFTAANPTNKWFGNKLKVMPGTSPGANADFIFTSADDGKFITPDNVLSTTDYVVPPV